MECAVVIQGLNAKAILIKVVAIPSAAKAAGIAGDLRTA
jgi:hypothetical protein